MLTHFQTDLWSIYRSFFLIYYLQTELAAVCPVTVLQHFLSYIIKSINSS